MASVKNGHAYSELVPLLALGGVVACLYLAREVLIPVALALLVSLVLNPIVSRLEKFGLPRLTAIVLVLVFAIAGLGISGWVVGHQLIDVANQLPNYSANIHKKIVLLHKGKQDALGKASDSVSQLGREISNATDIGGSTSKTVTGRPQPIPVVVEPASNPFDSFTRLLGPLVGPLTTVVVVVVFAVFMLLKHEDLRNRILRLAGQRHLNVMTEALDDAAQRVSRYLLLQTLVNLGYAILFSLGLYLIGVPNALFWGILAGVLRYVPYIGTLVAAMGPVLLAFAVFPGWLRPVMTVALFMSMETILANFIEPTLYGAHIGISSLALLLAAIFWTVLWGPLGLIVATPLTVCIVVLGRYIPQLEFISIALGDDPVLPLESQFYQRLLATDHEDAMELAFEFLKDKSLTELYDSVIIPALGLAETDRHQGALDETKARFIFQASKELVEDLGEREVFTKENPDAGSISNPGNTQRYSEVRIGCLPAHDEADEVAATMLGQLLQLAGYHAKPLAAQSLVGEMVQEISKEKLEIVCVSAVPPFALSHARGLCKRLRAQLPDINIVVGLWNVNAIRGAQERLDPWSNSVATSLSGAIDQVRQLAESVMLNAKDAQHKEYVVDRH